MCTHMHHKINDTPLSHKNIKYATYMQNAHRPKYYKQYTNKRYTKQTCHLNIECAYQQRISARDTFSRCASTQHTTHMQNIQIQLGDNGYTSKCINDALSLFLHTSSACIHSAQSYTRYTQKAVPMPNNTHKL